LRTCRAADLKTRYLIIVNLCNGRSVERTAQALQVARATVYRVAARFRAQGEAGLLDRRHGNGPTKLDRRYR
jgi:transposase